MDLCFLQKSAMRGYKKRAARRFQAIAASTPSASRAYQPARAGGQALTSPKVSL